MSGANGARSAALQPVPEAGTLPPQSLDAEMSVLGAVLLSDEQLGPLVRMGLRPGDFYRESHGAIFATMVELFEQGEPVDKLSVTARLERSGKLDLAGGKAAVDVLAGSPPVVKNAAHYGKIVRDTALVRRLLTETYRVQELVGKHTGDPYDLLDQVSRMMVEATTAPARKARLRKMDLQALIDMPDVAVPWRCDRLVADGHLTTIAGEGGEGKSILALQLAGGVQDARTVAGIECGLGKVVIFDAENGEWIMRTRLRASQMSIANLEIYDSDGIDLRNPHDQREIMEAAKGAQLIVFDSLRAMTPGAKEDSSDEMGPAVVFCKKVCRRTGAAGILVHHKGKGESPYRGSSVIRDQTDLMFALERAKGDPMGDSRRSLAPVKCRIAAEPPKRWFTIKGTDTELVLHDAAPYDPDEAPVRPKRDALQERIVAVIRAKGPMTRPSIARELEVAHNHKTFIRAVDDLVAAEVLAKTKDRLTQGVEWPTTPDDTLDTEPQEKGVSPLKGEDTSTPTLDGLAEDVGV